MSPSTPSHETRSPHTGRLLYAFLALLAIAFSTAGCDLFGDDEEEVESESVVDLLREYSGSSALYVRRADTTVAAYNADLKLPLASTVKYVIAIEYARQAATGAVDRDSLVRVADVNRFVVGVAPGPHRAWLDDVRARDLLEDGQVALREVARGMMDFSSNAAAEYMLDLLTPEKVNDVLRAAGLERHDPLYYLYSALRIGEAEGLTGDERAAFVRSLSPEERATRAAAIHRRLAEEGASYRESFEVPSREVQEAWSDHLPGSTVAEYVDLMAAINDRTLFDGEGFREAGLDSEAAQTYLYETLNRLVRTGDAPDFSYFGRKGGGTPWVLTQAGFGTYSASGEQTEYAIFFDGSPDDRERLRGVFSNFLSALFFDASYRQRLSEAFDS